MAASADLDTRRALALAPLAVAGTAQVALAWSPAVGRRRAVAAAYVLVAAGALVHLLAFNPFAEPGCSTVCIDVDPVVGNLLDRRSALADLVRHLRRHLPHAARDHQGEPDANQPSRPPSEQRRLGLPEENLLYFLEKNAPKLEDWQRELLRIVRLLSQYLYPQRQTQVMNEGCACFVHYYTLQRLHREGADRRRRDAGDTAQPHQRKS